MRNLLALVVGTAFASLAPSALADFIGRVVGTSRRAKKERQSKSWTMFGRLGLINVEKDDGFTLKRSSPKLGRLTMGIRKRF